MVWVAIALAIPASVCLLAFLFKFRYTIDYNSPSELIAGASLSFLWFRKDFRMDWGGDEAEAAHAQQPAGANPMRTADATRSSGVALPPESTSGKPADGQDGFLRVPFAGSIARFQRRFQSAVKKWVLDVPVWRSLAGYLLGSGRRVLRLLHPALARLHVGSEDMLNLGRFAGVWSVLRSLFPTLACPVEYGFGEKPFAIRLRLSGGFSALGLFAMLMTTFFTFPWLRLFGRFVQCWRNPKLNRWQRRVAKLAARPA